MKRVMKGVRRGLNGDHGKEVLYVNHGQIFWLFKACKANLVHKYKEISNFIQ